MSVRREAILDSALDVFLKIGPEATIEQICRRSGASNGSVYHHFGSKDGIQGELVRRFLHDYQRGFLAVLDARDGDARGGILAVVAHHLDWVVEHPDWARFLLRFRAEDRLPRDRELLRVQNLSFYARVESWFARHRLRELPLDVRAAILIGPAQEVSRAWLDGHSITRPDEAAGALGEAAWRALKP